MALIPEYTHLVPGMALPNQKEAPPVKVVVIAEADVAPDWQRSVSDWIVRSGCFYMMAWGAGCSSWDDAVDMANLQRFDFGDVPEDQFVITTWHEDELLQEVFWYSKHHAKHPKVQMDRTLILHISAAPREEELKTAYAAA